LLKLSIQQALLGEVTERLVSITCGLSERNIKIRAYVSGDVTKEDIERIRFVGTEVVADFSAGSMIEESCLSAAEHDEDK
jgi:hypothetical protein